LETWAHSSSQLFWLALFPQPHSPLCCAGSFSSTIGVEDDFPSKGGEWWGQDNHAYVHAWCMDWRRWSLERFSKSRRRSKVDPVWVPEVETKSNSSLSPGAVRNKTDAQVAYGVGFERSIYGWKHNFIELPMEPVSCQNSSRVNRNLWNKLMSRIC
jgi:hypothetical protein